MVKLKLYSAVMHVAILDYSETEKTKIF